jgi:hypothetical protein
LSNPETATAGAQFRRIVGIASIFSMPSQLR